MSHSMYRAGRTTHLKIVVVALLCAIVFAVMGKQIVRLELAEHARALPLAVTKNATYVPPRR